MVEFFISIVRVIFSFVIFSLENSVRCVLVVASVVEIFVVVIFEAVVILVVVVSFSVKLTFLVEEIFCCSAVVNSKPLGT